MNPNIHHILNVIKKLHILSFQVHILSCKHFKPISSEHIHEHRHTVLYTFIEEYIYNMTILYTLR